MSRRGCKNITVDGGMSCEEIARELKTTPRAVQQLLYTGMKKLRADPRLRRLLVEAKGKEFAEL